MSRLLMVERAILEVCGKSQKTIFQISNETGMDLSLVGSLCIRLNKKGILQRQSSTYSINKDANSLLIANTPENIKKEVNEVSKSMVANYFNQKNDRSLKLQKVYVNKTEELILKSMLDQLNSFVEELQKSHKKSSHNIVKKQKVIMWGHGNYSDLINSSLALAK
ncbi:hypothetical protein M902_0308 [Bacteriovorax sp. BAL6_X]|uniref:hypothetical protein n=1 Tax=Bacteriovorax sp. BAL6_X TaxID=1201290 RepID=UPI00038564F2|nr:hypothetical protein [Bacteriovorax sp. BAL6_X]EPZ50096.1 hypothetical protein M902_0308 [Bacteriovorax sp. BAL6_X]